MAHLGRMAETKSQSHRTEKMLFQSLQNRDIDVSAKDEPIAPKRVQSQYRQDLLEKLRYVERKTKR